jgi:acyl carrier protein
MASISGISETASSTPGTDGSAAVGNPAATIRAFLVDSFLLGEDDGFGNDESLLDAGVIDSTGVMEVVSFLEETFGIAVDDDDLVADNLDSVDRLAAFVARKVT